MIAAPDFIEAGERKPCMCVMNIKLGDEPNFLIEEVRELGD